MPSIKAGPTLSVPAGSVTTALMHHARVPGSNTTGGKKTDEVNKCDFVQVLLKCVQVRTCGSAGRFEC